jgi:hypothetical protein
MTRRAISAFPAFFCHALLLANLSMISFNSMAANLCGYMLMATRWFEVETRSCIVHQPLKILTSYFLNYPTYQLPFIRYNYHL